MAKKKSNSQSQPLSPKKYIMTKARSLPIYKCLINSDWEEAAMAHVIVCRKHTNGNITAGIFLVDMLERGLKDSVEVFNKPESEFNEVLENIFAEETAPEEIEYSLAHNVIYGGIEFAEDQGFDGEKKAGIAKYILEEDNEAIEYIEIPFGAERYLSERYTGYDDDDFMFDEFEEADWQGYINDHKDLVFLEDKEVVDSLFFLLMKK